MKPKIWYPLDTKYKPPMLLFRDRQLYELLKWTTRDYNIHIWGQGVPGVGKTLTANIFADEIRGKGIGEVYHIDCMRSLKETLRMANDVLGLGIPHYKLDAITLARRLVKNTPSEKRVIIIFDEPNKLLDYLLPQLGQVVHTIWNHMEREERKFNIIFLSQIRYVRVHKFFASDTMSRLQLKSLMFPSYNEQEIVDLLKQRLNLMFDEESYDIKALERLAWHVCQRIGDIEGGDMRKALNILRIAIEFADEKINEQAVNFAILRSKRKWWLNEIDSLPKAHAILLALTSSKIFERPITRKAEFREVKDQYFHFCKKYNMEPLSSRSIRRVFDQLVSKNYLEVRDSTGYGKGQKTYYTMDENECNHVFEASQELFGEWVSRL